MHIFKTHPRNETGRYLDPLWQHTKKLIKNPFNLTELKLCLIKSYRFLLIGEAAMILGQYSLFEYPIEKPYKADLFENKTFC